MFCCRAIVSNLSEVSRMVLVPVDTLVVLSSALSSASWMLSVLAHSTVAVRHVSAQLSSLSLRVSHYPLKCKRDSTIQELKRG